MQAQVRFRGRRAPPKCSADAAGKCDCTTLLPVPLVSEEGGADGAGSGSSSSSFKVMSARREVSAAWISVLSSARASDSQLCVEQGAVMLCYALQLQGQSRPDHMRSAGTYEDRSRLWLRVLVVCPSGLS